LIGILEKIFVEFGVPKIIKSDNGGTFRSKELAVFFKLHSIFHMKITPYWPNANGLCEGMMRIINKSIRTASANNENWIKVLDCAIKRYRAATHPATGYSPNEMEHLDDDIGLPNINYQAINEKILNSNDAKAKSKNKSYADSSKNAKPNNFAINDQVYFKWLRSKKHDPIFDPTPYKITDIKNTMITAVTPTGHSVTRNCAFFKKAITIAPIQVIHCFMFSDPLAGRREKQAREKLQRARSNQLQTVNTPQPFSLSTETIQSDHSIQNTISVPHTPTTTDIYHLTSPFNQTVPFTSPSAAPHQAQVESTSSMLTLSLNKTAAQNNTSTNHSFISATSSPDSQPLTDNSSQTTITNNLSAHQTTTNNSSSTNNSINKTKLNIKTPVSTQLLSNSNVSIKNKTQITPTSIRTQSLKRKSTNTLTVNTKPLKRNSSTHLVFANQKDTHKQLIIGDFNKRSSRSQHKQVPPASVQPEGKMTQTNNNASSKQTKETVHK